jgi:hypothetical protein
LNDDSPLVPLLGTGAKYVSLNSIHTASSQASEYKDIVKVSSPGTSIAMKNCVILNGYNSFTISYPETSLSLKYCTIYGTGNNAVTLGENNNMQPLIKDCILSCVRYPIEDLSGITENQIDYNLYCSQNNNVTDGGHSPEAGVSPGFVDPANGDFNLKPESPGVLSGISLTDVPYDLTGRQRSNPSFLGAYENTALLVMPDTITIEAGSGSHTEFTVRSNTNWTINDFDNWINLSVTSGIGSGNVSVIATSSNVTDKARNTELVVSGHGTGFVTIHVVQLPDIATLSKDSEKIPVLIYPNPVSSFLKVELNDENFSIISILNLRGEILRKEHMTEKEQQFDFSEFPEGVYIIELKSSANKVKRFKVVKS